MTTTQHNVTTWKTMKGLFAGFSYETQEEMRKLTSNQRHQERIQAAREAAKAWLYESHYDYLDLAAPALCYLEELGLCGGNRYNPGCGTRRHWAFRHLGTGRRKANDGGAWNAAIGDVARRDVSHVSLYPHPTLGVVVYVVGHNPEDGEAQFKLIPLLGGQHVDNPEYRYGVAEMARNAVYHAYHTQQGDQLLKSIAITLEEIRDYEKVATKVDNTGT